MSRFVWVSFFSINQALSNYPSLPVPVRNTNAQHLRDGFTKALIQRMHAQKPSEAEEKKIQQAIKDFGTKFMSGKIKKDTELVFTKTKKNELKMEYEVSSVTRTKRDYSL